jgi:sulfur-oxidizing protein SoxA
MQQVLVRWFMVLACLWWLPISLSAQTSQAIQAPDKARTHNAQRSGNAFLSADLLAIQNDATSNPVQLWLDQGRTLWGSASHAGTCFECHGAVQNMKAVATHYPQWSRQKQQLVNLEDQILTCSQRSGRPLKGLENPDVLSLSALLHQGSLGMPYQVTSTPGEAAQWQAALNQGAEQFTTRIGRMNLACTHCHDLSIGKQMRADVISPAHPTGFPIFKMSWQSMGSIDRRLRACFSGVQAEVPAPGSPVLRQLELFLKMRAQGLPIDGPSLRR